MNRDSGIARLKNEDFDIAIIGGGATGLGCAVDAASRGHSTALIEGADFASGTSSRSTKLVHGGVRYLQQGQIGLVREALHERTRLLRNAPGIVEPLRFVLPIEAWWQRPYYGTGLRLYDLVACGTNLPRSRGVGASEVRNLFPALKPQQAGSALEYWDAHFDDARLAIALAQTAANHGAAIANYVRAEHLLYEGSRLCGVAAMDRESGEQFMVRARCIVNATGIFADDLRKQDRSEAAPLLTFSRGSHIVVSTQALPVAQTALLVPRTDDGRVLFVLPWHGSVLIGTTDIPASRPQLDPAPSHDEIEYLLTTVNRYVENPLRRSDIRAAFAGLRPLVNRAAVKTARLSREHLMEVSPSGLITIAGGKWTTYRKMAQDTIDKAQQVANLPSAPSRTKDLRVHDVPLVPDLQHAIEREMARTIEDLLARRKRTLFIDVAAARREAASAAAVLAQTLGRDDVWHAQELQAFDAISQGYGRW